MPTLRCDCERGGDCSKVSVCTLTNALEEKDEQIERIRENVELARAYLRNDKFQTRIKNALQFLDEAMEE